ncbi:hypothetical protein [Kitasatospora sp. NPDC015120]|uniref:hypothetical protein n=1 Tax=Kitasatospora sp. NPDC015120 TaxID=3364023 RepID=UPI0036F46173
MGMDVELHSMAPPLPMDWEKSRCTLLSEMGDRGDILSDFISSLDPKVYPILGSLDPYGDSCLAGEYALRALVEVGKLKTSRSSIPSEKLAELERLMLECVKRPGAVLIFIGD